MGLLTLCYSELVPIQLFGIYSAIGVIVSLFFLFFFMPAPFQYWPLTEEAEGKATEPTIDPAFFSGWGNIGQWIIRHNGLVTAGGLAVMAVCTVGMWRMETSVQLMRLFSPKAKVVTDYEWLEENLGELIPMEVVINVDPLTSRLEFPGTHGVGAARPGPDRIHSRSRQQPVGRHFSTGLAQADTPEETNPSRKRAAVAWGLGTVAWRE